MPATANYLSNLLDLEVTSMEEDVILLKNEKVEFKVVGGASAKSKGNIVFDMLVEEQEELEELCLKAQFLEYRFGEKCSLIKNLDDEVIKNLIIVDLDGRRWRFKLAQ